MYEMVIYDTSDFQSFPIGGQLTSIRNFLQYVAERQTGFCEKILLVGLTTNADEVGGIGKVRIGDRDIDFMPILYRNSVLSNVQKSLRIEFLKALFKHRKVIPASRKVLHYIHTPEAFIQIKLCHPMAKTVIFSHGSFFNMTTGFRFMQKNKLVAIGFNIFLCWMLKCADFIFTLDENSTTQYRKFTHKVLEVDNSIRVPENLEKCNDMHTPIRLLFVGRLSKVKRVDTIVKAVAQMNGRAILMIVGDGEENENIRSLVVQEQLAALVTLTGAVTPSKVGEYMRNADILVMNSVLEGKPMTIIEAMSYGLPVITTPVGGVPALTEMHSDSEYTDGTVESIVEAIEKITKDYPTYSYHAREKSFQYDYRQVNAAIYQRIQMLYRA